MGTMDRLRGYAFLLGLLLFAPSPVAAQSVQPGEIQQRTWLMSMASPGKDAELWAASPSRAAGLIPLASKANQGGYVGQAEDHRWDGFAIGAVALGLGAAILGSQLCESHEDCFGTVVLFGLMGGTVGGVVGGLIGAGIPKD